MGKAALQPLPGKPARPGCPGRAGAGLLKVWWERSASQADGGPQAPRVVSLCWKLCAGERPSISVAGAGSLGGPEHCQAQPLRRQAVGGTFSYENVFAIYLKFGSNRAACEHGFGGLLPPPGEVLHRSLRPHQSWFFSGNELPTAPAVPEVAERLHELRM